MLTRHLQYNPGGCCCSWSTFFLQTLNYWRSPFSELLGARVQSTRGATSRFHLDFIHVLKYLTLGAAREYLYIFHEWEMPGSVRGVCVAAAAVVAPALRDHSSMNKALAVFNFQRCQPDLSRAGSWYISPAVASIVLLLSSYTDTQEYTEEGKFTAFVKG